MSPRAEAVSQRFAAVTGEGRCLVPSVRRGESFSARLLGLMGRTGLGPGEGLWLEPSNGIHMFFMRFPIDAAFVDRSGRVLRVDRGLRPWRLGGFLFVPGARATLEVAAGTLRPADLRRGDRLELVTAEAPSSPDPHDRPAAGRLAVDPGRRLAAATQPGGPP